MSTLVECVPNISEGRNQAIIDDVVSAYASVDGVRVLDVDPGASTHRTVITLVGPPAAIEESAFRGIARAAQRIDMRKHSGSHPRQGATDVCPFVPVSGIDMAACVEIARRVAKRVGDELNLPVYLYEEAAVTESRRNLADVRRGEYEALSDKIGTAEWKPDFGPSVWSDDVARTGSTQIAAREFLIAWNVNLNTTDKALAHDIALEVREVGRAHRDANNEIIRDADGKPIKTPGRLKHIKAVGWYVDEFKLAQVSINQINFRKTSLHETYEVIDEEARKRGARVLGAELVGLVPKQAILDAAHYYLARQKRSAGIPEADLIDMGVKSLGLDTLTPFDPKKKIIDLIAEAPETPQLGDLPAKDLSFAVMRATPTPGGGSVAAHVGSLGAALAAMVCNLTIGKRGFEERYASLSPLAERMATLSQQLHRAIDEDTDAYDSVLQANRLPEKSDTDRATKVQALLNANRMAAEVPLKVVQLCRDVLRPLGQIVAQGNPNSISDGGVGAHCALAAAESAHLNVLINLQSLADHSDVVSELRTASEEAIAEVRQLAQDVVTKVLHSLG